MSRSPSIDNGTQAQEIESVYLQDEWKVFAPLTLNYGLRFDHYSAYSSGSQLSPRVNFVWQLGSGTTVHGGYSRYFTPPPFELIASETFTKFAGTTAVPPGSVTLDTPPIAERANYYDFGVQQKLLNNTLTLGVDSFYEQSQHLIDEGQFGAPIILTPFNYRYGLIGGVEFTANYSVSNFSAYGNLSFQAAHGKDVESSQFNFIADDLAYIADNYIHLDHEGRVAASGGVSYLWLGTRFSADMLFGTGLRDDLTLPNGFDHPERRSHAELHPGQSGAEPRFPTRRHRPADACGSMSSTCSTRSTRSAAARASACLRRSTDRGVASSAACRTSSDRGECGSGICVQAGVMVDNEPIGAPAAP